LSELRSVVEAFLSEMLPDLPDARIEEDFAELQRAVELLEAERLRRLCEIDRRRLFERDGHLSSASWLATRHKVAWGTARENVRISRALDDMPETRRALDEGQISMSAVRVLAAARDADPTASGVSEPQLVEVARIHSMHDLQRVASYWRQGVEGEQAATGDEKARERRKLHASVSFLGMVRVDGDLVHWAQGGPTTVSNLLLLCRRHHRMVHDRDGFRLELLDGQPVFRRPDGTLLEDRAPP
jgi:hypothetical protein